MTCPAAGTQVASPGDMPFALFTSGDASPELARVPAAPVAWLVEDEATVAALGAELCQSAGVEARVFPDPVSFLGALRGEAKGPDAVVLDWRLQHELSSALFLAVRHRYPQLRVVCWTGSAEDALPEMIRRDPLTRFVDKAAGADAFEAGLRWAVAGGATQPTEEEAGHDDA